MSARLAPARNDLAADLEAERTANKLLADKHAVDEARIAELEATAQRFAAAIAQGQAQADDLAAALGAANAHIEEFEREVAALTDRLADQRTVAAGERYLAQMRKKTIEGLAVRLGEAEQYRIRREQGDAEREATP